MAYEKTTWQSGDVVTSAKLNNIENGIANREPLICEAVEENLHQRLNQTGGDVYNAFISGRAVLLKIVDTAPDVGESATMYWSVSYVAENDGKYYAQFLGGDYTDPAGEPHALWCMSLSATDYMLVSM